VVLYAVSFGGHAGGPEARSAMTYLDDIVTRIMALEETLRLKAVEVRERRAAEDVGSVLR